MKSGTNVHTNQIISTDREKTHWNEKKRTTIRMDFIMVIIKESY